jgi:hypothetical protein
LFISQLFDTQYQILARKDDPALAFTRLEQLQAAGIPLMVIKGSGSAIYFQGLPGLSYLDAPLSVDAAMQQLKAGRGRLFAYYDLGNDWFLDQLGYRDSLAALGVKFDKDTQWLCVSKSLPAAQAARLGETVDALRKTPEWASLMKRYHL